MAGTTILSSGEQGGGEVRARVDWGRAIVAGLLATVIMTVTMALFGMNIMKSLGTMLLRGSTSTMMQYLVGGLMHFMMGIVYALIYAALVAPRLPWHPVAKGALYGAVLTVIALVMMPVMASALGGRGAANPCNPCGGATAAKNPCNPRNPTAAKNPRNPCKPDTKAAADTAKNPCNPCGAEAKAAASPANPCDPRGGAANPCNPCGGGGSTVASALISLVNHLVYGIALALLYAGGGAAVAPRRI